MMKGRERVSYGDVYNNDKAVGTALTKSSSSSTLAKGGIVDCREGDIAKGGSSSSSVGDWVLVYETQSGESTAANPVGELFPSGREQQVEEQRRRRRRRERGARTVSTR